MKAIKEVAFIAGERQKAQAQANAFFTSVPYSEGLRLHIERSLPVNRVVPEHAIQERFTVFGDFGWMKSVDLARIDHPFDLRGADRGQAFVADIIQSFAWAGFETSRFDRSHPDAQRRNTVRALAGDLGERGLFVLERDRLLGSVTFPGEKTMWFAKHANTILDAQRIPIPQAAAVLQLPQSDTVELVPPGLDAYVEGQFERQEQGHGSIIPVSTTLCVFREAPDVVLDSAEYVSGGSSAI